MGVRTSQLENLKSIVIPNSVTSIGVEAFSANGVSIIPLDLYIEDLRSFLNIDFAVDWNIGREINLYIKRELVKDLVIPDGVESIGDNVFSCFTLESITLPAGLKSIGRGAFYGCIYLSSLTIPDSVTSIGEDAFADCDSLQQIVLKNANCMLFQTETTFPKQAIIVSENSGSVEAYADSYQRAFVTLPILYGDINEDESIMVEDAVLILTAYARGCAGLQNQLSDRQKIAADYNQDGSIQVEDAVAVLNVYARHSAGLGT